MLELYNLHCKIRNKTLISIDQLTVSEKTLFAVSGPNGAGKSTLFKVIAGDLPYTGKISLHGQALHNIDLMQRAKHLAVLPQHSQLSFPFTAKEVVEMGATPLALSKQQKQHAIKQNMHRCDCLDLQDRDFSSLSGGEKQRVQLARVLLQLSQAEKAPMLLLDEPTSAQDLGQQHNVLSLARELASQQGYIVIAIIHDLNQVLRFCDEAIILANGELAGHGKPEDILDQDNIEKHWNYRASVIETAGRRLIV